jgi:DNA-binding CsgD family transcriptional regulator
MSLPRQRLTALLAEPALTSVELVIAPPGFGKTTLLREYTGIDPDAVFVALPEATDLEAFVRSVIAVAVPSALHSLGALFDGPSEQKLDDRVSDWLVSRLRGFSGTLIVDDFHRAAGDERVARMLVSTIAATHGRMRWIVSSRESPPFPMGSWIARGWMGLPITGDDLSFTPGEAGALAEQLAISMSAAALHGIIDETLGWPIGVRLALSLVARNRGIGQTRVQTREALFALLDDEVWKPLEHDLRELIAAAALMPAPAIATLEAAGYLTARAGMTTVFARVPFIQPIDDEAFAIHDLFREFVATQASRDRSVQSSVSARMGIALVGSGSPADGIRLLIESANVAGVANVLSEHAFSLLETGQRSIVNSAVAFLCAHGLDDSGIVLAIRGVLAFADGSASNSTNLFIRSLERNPPPSIRGEVSRKLAVSYANRGMLKEALDTLSPLETDASISLEDRLEVRAMSTSYIAAAGTRKREDIDEMIASIEVQVSNVQPNVQARLLQRLGTAAFYNSSAEKSERLSQDAALLATELGMDALAAASYGTLYSLAAWVDSDSVRAQSFSRAQAAAAERAANTALRVYALRAQYVIAALNLDFDEARGIESALASLVDVNTYRQTFLFRLARALQYLAQSDAAKAEATIRSMPVAPLSASERARCDALLVLFALLRGRRAEASTLLERGLLSEAPSDIGGRIELAYAHAYRAVAYWVLDRPAQARRAFDFKIVELPQRDRILVDVLKEFSALPHPLPNSSAIDALCETLGNAGFRAYAILLKRLVELDANDVALSAAELETLREFDRFGGRAADVAKALGKSRYTVQNQIQSAIKKLGCSGRAEALAYARQRGWLDRASN